MPGATVAGRSATSGKDPAAEGVTGALSRTASGPWTDLGLTLPLFLAYHLGVVYLPVRNAADWMTQELVRLVDADPKMYCLLTLSIALVYVGGLLAAGRGQALRAGAFAWLLVEAVVYASAMRFAAAYVTARLVMAQGGALDAFSGLILSLGAGFYEEVAFRVGLFGLGLRAFKVLFVPGPVQRALLTLGWAVATSALFSLWHYLGPVPEPLELRSFVFRTTCGLVFVVIYALRGFAPAVWTHTLYDVWVMVF